MALMSMAALHHLSTRRSGDGEHPTSTLHEAHIPFVLAARCRLLIRDRQNLNATNHVADKIIPQPSHPCRWIQKYLVLRYSDESSPTSRDLTPWLACRRSSLRAHCAREFLRHPVTKLAGGVCGDQRATFGPRVRGRQDWQAGTAYTVRHASGCLSGPRHGAL